VEAKPREILICHTDDDRKPFLEWLEELDPKTRGIVRNRIDRIESGNMGDTRSVGGEGVVELRIDFGPGYRIYFGQLGNQVHLINGGSKQKQDADIGAARNFWEADD
jgi:putative addiction module killer protein